MADEMKSLKVYGVSKPYLFLVGSMIWKVSILQAKTLTKETPGIYMRILHYFPIFPYFHYFPTGISSITIWLFSILLVI